MAELAVIDRASPGEPDRAAGRRGGPAAAPAPGARRDVAPRPLAPFREAAIRAPRPGPGARTHGVRRWATTGAGRGLAPRNPPPSASCSSSPCGTPTWRGVRTPKAARSQAVASPAGAAATSGARWRSTAARSKRCECRSISRSAIASTAPIASTTWSLSVRHGDALSWSPTNQLRSPAQRSSSSARRRARWSSTVAPPGRATNTSAATITSTS